MSDDSSDAWSDESAESNDEPPNTEDTMTDTVDETDDGTEHHAVDNRTEQDEGRDLWRTLNYALLAGLSLLALIATLQLYFNVSSAINQWITYEYRSLFQAAFNLTVLLLVSAGMVWQVRRMRE